MSISVVIQMSCEYYIAIHKISGTDPHKETYVYLRKTREENFVSVLDKCLSQIYDELSGSDELSPSDDENAYKEAYENEHAKWKNLITKNEVEKDELFIDMVQLCEKLKEQRDKSILSNFTEPDAILIAVDRTTSYDFHYFIEWKMVPVNEDDYVEFVIHEH